MQSIKDIFRIGNGPSSSHTMGPLRATRIFKDKHANASSYRVTLYGSLAATGKGHFTDTAIINEFKPISTEIIWKPKEFLPEHPNGLTFEAIDNNGNTIDSWTTFSIGGGALWEDNLNSLSQIYPHKNMHEILHYLNSTGKTYWEYVEEFEGPEIWIYLAEVWEAMKNSIHNGLENDGVIPGTLHLSRKAALYNTRSQGFSGSLKRKTLLFSYALAVSEENASCGKVVTAPTCGSCGVLPAVLYHISKDYEMPENKILKALATAGIFGNVIKTNGSISGAEVGCQGEIGSACAMAAAAATKLFGGTPPQIEYAAEMGLEHHLGLTCDPIGGFVQIPCIERNAFAATRALDASAFAILSDGHHYISFDKVIETMLQTGHDLPSLYKETSIGGLAAIVREKDEE